MLASSPSQFIYLSERRLQEAIALLAKKYHMGALYLAGYVVECSLKALIAKQKGGTLPPEWFTHDLHKLRAEVLHYLKDEHVPVVQAVPSWSYELRYTCSQPPAKSVVEFLDRAKEVYRCLSTYL